MKDFTTFNNSRLPLGLFAKSLLITTRFANFAATLRWHLLSLYRYRHPELMDLYLEERQLPFVLQRLIQEDSNAVDIGCHIGSFLRLLTQWAPRGHHIAFEPSLSKSEWLRKRFPEAEVIASAVADQSGSACFVEDLEKPGFSRLAFKSGNLPRGDKARTRTYQVSVCRLDDVLLSRRVDLIKLDIEGGELPGLRGAKHTIERWQPSIIFECGPEFHLQTADLSRSELFDFISQELGYKIYTFSDFLFDKGGLSADEFRKCGLYPFRAFNFIALPHSKETDGQMDRAGRRLDYRGIPFG